MASVTQLGYLGVGVSNLEAWEGFATEVLGLQVSDKDSEGSLFLRMDEHHHRFILTPGGDDDLAFVGWEVCDQKALAQLTDQLRAGGIEVSSGTPAEARRRRVVELVKFRDPSGIPSEAYFGPLMNFENPFKSPRTISGFDTGALGLGHIVIRADDSAASLKFYRDLLGMRISDFIDLKMRRGSDVQISMTFMHCNPRHHSLAFAEFPIKKRLLHFMLQAKELDDIGSTFYLAQDKGVEIAGSIGRHTNDQMVSFYMRSPSGFEVEYGFGARTVDDSVWQVQRHEAGSIWGHRGLLSPSGKPSRG